MCIECGLPTVWDLLKGAYNSLKGPVAYAMSSKSFANSLREEVGKLESEDRRVDDLAEGAKKNLRDFSDCYKEWKQRANKALVDARNRLEAFEKDSKTCCYGTLPDPYYRYQFSTETEAEIKVVRDLTHESIRFRGMDDITSIDPAAGRGEGKDIIHSTTTTASVYTALTSIKFRDHGVFESRALIIQDIMDALADSSKSVVGVYGMGGVGKSTLLKDVKRIVSEEKWFDWVAKADVSKNPDIKTIQGEIADALGLTDIKNKETISVRAELLHRRLEEEEREKKKVLIILDNLWGRLDLDKVGIPCGPDNEARGCKLLLTSRDLNILQRDMGCDKAFPLGGLQEEEARALFERLVGDKVHDDEFKPWVEVALHRCAGVPFLIVAMAKRFKNAELFAWKDALRNMEKFNHEEINGFIDDMLKWSYYKLKDEAKALLRLCVVYSVSKPSLENLVRYGFGLGLFQQVSSMEEARDRLHTQIRALQASSLLLDSEDVGGFKIHDLVREFVASVSSRDHPLLMLEDKDMPITKLRADELKSCEAMCFPNMKELPQELYCPELCIFLLFTSNYYLKISHSYFNSMGNLMALHLTGIHLSCSPSPFQFLEKLHSLCLDYCLLDDVAILGKLKSLQILSLHNSHILQLPKEIGQLTELRLLDLDNCPELHVIEPGVLGRLTKLEELDMRNSFKRWNALEPTPASNACLIELNNMKKLRTLYVSILDPSVVPKDLDVEKLTKYRIQIGDAPCWSNYEGSRRLELKLDPTSNVLRKDCIQSILDKTDDLFLDGLNETKQSICALSEEGFPKLKHLHVEGSPSVRYILGRSSLPTFKALEMLRFENLINLEKICHNHISIGSFSTLKVVRVKSCAKMEVLFPRSVVRELTKLEEIKVVGCKLIKGIVEADDDHGKLELPKLRVLELRDLRNIENFVIAGSAPSSSSSNIQVALPRLATLEINGLDNLRFMFFPSMVKSLTQLRKLWVNNCKKIEAIIMEEEGLRVEISETLAFPMLTDLRLQHMESLVCFSRGKCSQESQSQDGIQSHSSALFNREVNFPRLETLEINGLGNLGFIFFPPMVKSLIQLRDLSVSNCKKMEAIIIEEEGLRMETSETLAFPMLTDLSLEHLESLTCFFHVTGLQETQSQDHVKSHSSALFSQEVAFPSLETLYITRMDNIKMIWDNQVVADSFPKIKSLCVDGCNKFVTVVPSLILGQLLFLESLRVEACDSLEVVFELQPINPLDGHPIALLLKELTVSRLPKLKCVWDKELHHQVKFQSLRSVSVFECQSLTSLFPASITRDLIQLEELEIRECGIVELIGKEEGLLVPKSVFPNLTSLKLMHLTELKSLYSETHTSHWPALKTLKVDGCYKMQILISQTESEIPCHKQSLFLIEKGAFPNLQELKLDLSERVDIWQGNFHDEESFRKLKVLKLRHLLKEYAISTCRFVESLTNLEELVVSEFYLEEPTNNVEAIDSPCQELKVILPFSRRIQHLKTLDVSHSNGLSSLFTPTIAENLVALTKLRISNCKILTEVISDEEFKEELEVAFNQLKYMELEGLIELRSFSSRGYTLVFPLLEDVIVNGCPNMEVFSKGPIKAPKLERVKVDLKEQYFWKGNLNITIQNMYEKMASIAKAKFMRLFDFPKLIEKWHSDLNPLKSSWQLDTLVVDKCPSFINAMPSKLILVLEKMTCLQVRDCESLEEIFDFQGLEAVESTWVLPHLGNLDLINLPKLRQLWNKDLQGMMCFNSLSSLTLYKCNNLRYAFTPSMARCLANLNNMKIRECNQMEGVIKEEEGQGSTMEKITFPKLGQMILKWLPNLTSFLLGKNYALDCPKVHTLRIAHCPKMRSLTWHYSMDIEDSTPSLFTPQVQFLGLRQMVLSHMNNLSKIWLDNTLETLTFDSFRKVEVQNCERLENLFPYWVATSLTQLEKLQVESCRIEEIVTNGNDTPHSNIAQALFPELTSLALHDMSQLKTFCPNLPALNWPFLEELRVTHCDKMNMLSFAASINKWTQRNDQQHLLDQEAHSSFERDFPKLKGLLLYDKNIWMIQDGKYHDDIFGKLKALTLACFHNENAVFPSRFLLERFQNIESLELFCSSFEDIFPNEGLVDEGKHPVLKNLRELKLSKLHMLKPVWRDDYLVSKVLRSIKTLEICDCPCLTTLFPTAASFQNLTELVVKNSSGLVHLGTASAIASLAHLTSMTVIGCERMKEVVTNDENGEGKVISFGKLQWLRLQNMPSLECFSSTPTSCSLRFSSLRKIEVKECPKMKIFSKGKLSTPRLLWGTLFGYDWNDDWKGDLNKAIQKLLA